MRILIVSQYYPPERGATQNRLGSIADGLAVHGHEVTVICEQPCHPAGVFQPGFGRRPMMIERRGGMTIRRLWVATWAVKTRSRRLAFYGTFAAGAASVGMVVRRPDVIFTSSPPLPGCVAAAAVAQARRIPLVVDVRDLWPAAAEALGELSNAQVIRALERLERWLYRRASTVTATTRPFCKHIDQVTGRNISVHVPNGALDELVAMPERPPPAGEDFVVGYAGNLGIAQGLGIVLDAAERLKNEPVHFRLVGDGPLSGELQQRTAARGLTNVSFQPMVPVPEVGEVLHQCHALLVPLRAHSVLEDFIPSKLYDAMAVGRPAIVAARGEAAALTEETGVGLVIPPEDGEALATAVRTLASDSALVLRLGETGKRASLEFARSQQLLKLERLLLEAAGELVVGSQRAAASRA